MFIRRVLIFLLVLDLSIVSPMIYASTASWAITHTIPQKVANSLLTAQYTITNTVTNVSKVIAAQLSKPQVARILAYVIARRYAAFGALILIAAQAGISTIDNNGEALLVQQLPATSSINALQVGDAKYVPIIGMLSPSYCTTALAQINYRNALYGPYAPSGANWCQVVNISPTYKELSLTVQSPAGIDTITIQPTAISPSQVNQPIAGYFAVPDTVLADTVYDKATTQQLSPLFDYNEEYQSPAAIDAINQFNATAVEPFPTYTDITTPALGNPVKTTPTTDTAELPIFCSWATTVCEFMDWVKAEPAEPDPSSNNVPIKRLGISDIPELQNVDIDQKRISFNSYCPADVNVTFDVMGSAQNLHFSYQPLCDLLSKVRPIVIASAYITGAYIVSGAARREG